MAGKSRQRGVDMTTDTTPEENELLLELLTGRFQEYRHTGERLKSMHRRGLLSWQSPGSYGWSISVTGRDIASRLFSERQAEADARVIFGR